MQLDDSGQQPLCFDWNQQEHWIASQQGPQRIETGWWRAAMIRRDYYRIETASGARFWLFQELKQRHWFLHGMFD